MAIPILIVIVSGLLLQVKKQVSWVQPPTQKGNLSELSLTWDEILLHASAVPEAEISTWQDIDRLDVRPSKGVVKIRCKNNWEIQLDSSDGSVLSSDFRRSDIIESIHDGSFFSDYAKLWLFLPNGFVLLILWFTGMVLWYLPVAAKRKKKGKANQP